MSALTRILKNTSALALAQIANPIISITLTLTVARLTGTQGLGVYTFVLSILALFEIMAGLGIRDYVIREVARRPSEWGKYFSTSVVIGLVSAGILQFALFLFAQAMDYEPIMTKALFIAGFALFPTVVAYFAQSIFYANQRMEFVSAITVGENLVKASVGIACLYLGFGLLSLFWAFLLSRVFSALWLIVLLFRKMGRPAFGWDRHVLRALLKVSPTFIGLGLAAALYWRVDILFLSKWGGSAALGTYSAAYRLMYIFYLLASSLMTALFPLFSKSFAESIDHFRLLSAKTVKYLLLVLVPMATTTTLLAPSLVPFLYGDRFGATVTVLQVAIWMIVPLGIAKVFANALIASNRQDRDLRVNLVRLAFNVALTAVLVPRYGALGAAIATLISLVTGVALQYRYLPQLVSMGQLARYLGKPAIASFAMAGVIVALQDNSVALAVSSGFAVYVGVLLLQGTFNGRDRALLDSLRFERGVDLCR
jgi:O-antigen/teichoic acid export membrane protein